MFVEKSINLDVFIVVIYFWIFSRIRFWSIAQICIWDYSDPCNVFPTLYFDVFVDSFFLVFDSYLPLILCKSIEVNASKKLFVMTRHCAIDFIGFSKNFSLSCNPNLCIIYLSKIVCSLLKYLSCLSTYERILGSKRKFLRCHASGISRVDLTIILRGNNASAILVFRAHLSDVPRTRNEDFLKSSAFLNDSMFIWYQIWRVQRRVHLRSLDDKIQKE